MLVLKYRPLRLDDYVQNATTVSRLRDGLSPGNHLFFGPSGAGKTAICGLLLQELGLRGQFVTQQQFARPRFREELTRYRRRGVVVLDNLQHYTSAQDRAAVLDLAARNHRTPFLRLVLITNSHQGKFVAERLGKLAVCYEFRLPSTEQAAAFLQRVCAAEGLQPPSPATIAAHRHHIGSLLGHLAVADRCPEAGAKKYAAPAAPTTADALQALLAGPLPHAESLALARQAAFVLPTFVYTNFYRGRALPLDDFCRALEHMRQGEQLEQPAAQGQPLLQDSQLFHSVLAPVAAAVAHPPRGRVPPPRLVQYFNKRPPQPADALDAFRLHAVERFLEQGRHDELRAYLAAREIDLEALLRRFGQLRLVPVRLRRALQSGPPRPAGGP